MSLEGRTALVTGATDGVGKLVALRLAQEGALVLLHGRDESKGETVMAEIRAQVPGARLEFYRADFASLDEVRAMGEAVLADHRRLHILVNNAGVALFSGQPRSESQDGYELHFAVNYLSHFLLTLMLLALLRDSAPARIVNVSSLGQAPVDFDDVMLNRGYSGERGYCQSKLAQIMFTFDLSERLKGTGVTATALHPATFMNTNMVVGQGLPARSRVEDGAEAIYRLAASPEVEGDTGVFFNQTSLGKPHEQAFDAAARARLWQLSLRLAHAPVEAVN
jgi:NAD(P)-dependent dehydrogenase (short-subunit alcohol dehydrogenase family)